MFSWKGRGRGRRGEGRDIDGFRDVQQKLKGWRFLRNF